jgi:hypothetical protein
MGHTIVNSLPDLGASAYRCTEKKLRQVINVNTQIHDTFALNEHIC